MSKFKGTPGPWFWENNVLCNKDFIVGGNSHTFHNQANKDLIAAAPELLEALKKCTDALGEVSYQSWCGEIIEESRAAIAKALGESK